MAGALRSPAQHKPGLSPSLREVSWHRSGRGKQKLQSREREEEEEEEGQRKQESEGHYSPARPPRRCPRPPPSPGGQPAQRRLPICFGGGSAAQAAPQNRRTEKQAGEPAPPSFLPSLPPALLLLPAAARPARRSAPEPRPRRGSASRGRARSGRRRWDLPGGAAAPDPPPPLRARPAAPAGRGAARAGLSCSAGPPCVRLRPLKRGAGCWGEVGGGSCKNPGAESRVDERGGAPSPLPGRGTNTTGAWWCCSPGVAEELVSRCVHRVVPAAF